MIATLPMYWRPETAEAHDRYWLLLRAELEAEGVDSPAELARFDDETQAWTDPGLVLSQTCGMPYRNDLHGRVALVGTPDYRIDGCPPGYGRSVFVVRADDDRAAVGQFRDGVFAYNARHSDSGYASPYRHTDALGFWFGQRRATGQHVQSARAVASGEADIASIDVVTWRQIQAFDPFATGLRVIDQTEPVPWLPYVSRLGAPVDQMAVAVQRAIDALSEPDRMVLGVHALAQIPAEAYLAVANPAC